MNFKKRAARLSRLLVKLVKNQLFPRESYLGEGTAIYFYLGYRFSVDWDFFTPKPFYPEILLFRMRETVNEVDVEILEKDTFNANLSRGKIKFSLFYFPYELLSPLTPYKLTAETAFPLQKR